PARLPCVFSSSPSPPPAIYTLSLHDALPIYRLHLGGAADDVFEAVAQTHFRPEHLDLACQVGRLHRTIDDQHQFLDVERFGDVRSEEHTSELQSRGHLVCRLLLEKKN